MRKVLVSWSAASIDVIHADERLARPKLARRGITSDVRYRLLHLRSSPRASVGSVRFAIAEAAGALGDGAKQSRPAVRAAARSRPSWTPKESVKQGRAMLSSMGRTRRLTVEAVKRGGRAKLCAALGL